jgi:hypothetical protein
MSQVSRCVGALGALVWLVGSCSPDPTVSPAVASPGNDVGDAAASSTDESHALAASEARENAEAEASVEPEPAVLSQDDETEAATPASRVTKPCRPATRLGTVDKVTHTTCIILPAPQAKALSRQQLAQSDVMTTTVLWDRLAAETMHAEEDEFVAIMRRTEANGDRLPTAIDDDPSLVTFRPGERLTIVSTLEPRRTRARFFAAFAGDGQFFAFVDELADPLRPSLAVRGTVSPTAVLRAPVTGASTPRDLAFVEAALGAKVPRTRWSQKNLSVAELSLGGEIARLVAFALSLDYEDPDADYPGYWSGIWAEQADGTRHVVVKLRRRLHDLGVEHLVDLDGDGTDEIVFHSEDGHSGYTYLAWFDGRTYRNLRLSGSGG